MSSLIAKIKRSFHDFRDDVAVRVAENITDIKLAEEDLAVAQGVYPRHEVGTVQFRCELACGCVVTMTYSKDFFQVHGANPCIQPCGQHFLSYVGGSEHDKNFLKMAQVHCYDQAGREVESWSGGGSWQV